MKETENITINQSEFEIFIRDFGDKIKGYVNDLKQHSSNEILNGSVQKAQRLLDKIMMVEEGVEKVRSAHDYLLAILEQDEADNLDSSYINEKFQEKKQNGKSVNKQLSGKFRMPLLKALIYLGGSAEENEMIEFIRKEASKIFSKEEAEAASDGSNTGWIKELREECDVMKDDQLLKFDSSRNQWEITQKGIDCLAKMTKK